MRGKERDPLVPPGPDGRLISTYMPSSSFYHVYSALTVFARP